MTYLPKFEYKRDDLTVDGRFAIAESKSSYSPNSWDSIQNAGTPALTGIDFQATRSHFSSSDWNVVQTAGSDWNDGRFFTTPAVVVADGRLAQTKIYSGDVIATLKTTKGIPTVWKTGVKMKTESEFGFEPSLLVEMERVQTGADGKLQSRITHRATVIKDRFGALDGKECDNPSFEFFKPFVERLNPGAHVSVDTTRQTDLAVNEAGDAAFHAERKHRAIFCEEIQGALLASFPGQSADEKKAKASLIQRLFNTYSWTAVESMDSAKLKAGLDALPAAITEYRNGAPAEKPAVEKIVEKFTSDEDEKETKKRASASAGKGGK
jgi:hypothetical protein